MTTATIIAGLALIISLGTAGLTAHFWNQQNKESVNSYLSTVWHELMSICHKYPKYLDISTTEHYEKIMNAEEIAQYDAYCYKAWVHVQEIIDKGYDKNHEFSLIISLVAGYHSHWLKRNPTLFTNPKLWKAISDYRNRPNLIFGYRNLPMKDGDVNWDIVAEDYHNYILGPFAPEMTKPDPGKNNARRNKLLDYLDEIVISERTSIIDFGCGPGNLIHFLDASKIKQITCVDKNETALAIAEEVGKKWNIAVRKQKVNIKDYRPSEKYDIAISVNSILPEKRSDIPILLKRIVGALNPGGRFIAILPSYDTTEYLCSLWRKHYSKILGDNSDHVDRIIKAFEVTKKMNGDPHYSYADDGRISQCYHTKETIEKEFREAGLEMGEPKKIYYPWELTKRFDYGYFPDAPEEIWDWFVVARVRA